MSMYFLHNRFTPLSDDIYQSIFRYLDGSNDQTVLIKIKADAIDFYYELEDRNLPVQTRRQKPLFTLPLDTPEHCDYFLLNLHNLKKYILTERRDYRLFFAEQFPDQKIFENPCGAMYTGINEVMLCLFEEVNNPGSDISRYSPVTWAAVKQNLERSPVYRLIMRKSGFYKALYEWLESGRLHRKKQELEIALYEFLDVILNDTVSSEIPPDYFKAGRWFENPQTELEYLAGYNTEFNIRPEISKSIQNYLLKKHAVLSALKIASGNWYPAIIAGEIISTIAFALLWAFWMAGIYSYSTLFLGIGVLSCSLSLIIIVLHPNYVNLLLPRSLIAVASALFLLIGSEDILKNQLTVNTKSLMIIISSGLILLVTFLYSEAKQHSPFYRIRNTKGLSNYKIVPILIHVFNIANILVICSQLAVTDTFIDRSLVLKNSIFSKQFDKLDYIRDQYSSYADKLQNVLILNSYTLTLFMDSPVYSSVYLQDSINKKLVYSVTKSKLSNPAIIAKQLEEYNSKYSELLITDSTLYKDMETRNLVGQFVIKPRGNTRLMLPNGIERKYGSNFHKIIRPLLDTLCADFDRLRTAYRNSDSIVSQLDSCYYAYSEDSKLKSFITETDTPQKNKLMNPDYGFALDSSNIYIYKLIINLDNSKKDFALYPRMLILQVIIIMLVGLVGQLIISDRNITEPL